MSRIVNKKKNDLIKEHRGASFEEIVSEGVLLDVKINKNYPNQEFEIYYFQKYVWVVVVGKNPDRFITAYKSRKLKKEYGYE
jgi:hypothetical protein